MVKRALWLPTLTLLLLAPRPAAPADSPEQQAGALAARAVSMARAGDLAKAVELFEAAYALDPVPILLYNVGRVRDRMGDGEGARAALARYVELEPDPEARARGLDALAEVEARRAPIVAPAAPTTVLARPPSDRPPVANLPPVAATPGPAPVDRTWLWLGVGTGAALLVAGGITAAVLLTGRGRPAAADGVMTIPLGAVR